MNQYLHLITLGVTNLERSRQFYSQTLGWIASNASNESVAFYQAGGVVLGLYPRALLAEDALTSPQGSGFSGITLAHNTRSESEVDEIIRDLKDTSRSPRRCSGADIVPTLPTPMTIFGRWPTTPSSRSTKAGI